MADWHNNGAKDLESAVAYLKARLPGWWWTVCECQVSCEARIAPTIESEHITLIGKFTVDNEDPFDSGFDVGIMQPTTCAEALVKAVDMALEEIERRS